MALIRIQPHLSHLLMFWQLLLPTSERLSVRWIGGQVNCGWSESSHRGEKVGRTPGGQSFQKRLRKKTFCSHF